MDAAFLNSLQAATRISLDELRDLNALATSSPRFGAGQDELVARDLWRQELERFSRMIGDRQMAQDLQQALRENRSVEAVRREREERQRAAAPQVPVAAQTSRTATDSLRQAHAASSTSRATSSSSTNAAFSSRLPSSSTASTSSLPCFICTEAGVPSVTLPCGHHFCRPCLGELFLLATKDESLSPASCCSRTVDPSWMLSTSLTLVERSDYRKALDEFGTKNRLYCSRASCSAFLGKAGGPRRMITCESCGAGTCAACKSPEHSRSEACAADTDDSAAAKLATALRGTRCLNCKRVVVKNGGCENV
ncbi:hypothetical protein JCM10213_000678 [Rhodosporidiobolus nylandii]